jgi:hypothetical protein
MTENKQEQHEENPGFYDLMDHSEANIVKRATTRYLTTRNYERSIKMYEAVGMRRFKNLVMKTAGRAPWHKRTQSKGYESNYHMGTHKGRMEEAMNFAYHGSVFNEVVHAAVSVAPLGALASELAERNVDISAAGIINKSVLALNLCLVGLQRYNRARMIGVVDTALKAGKEFNPYYESWTGIDSRAAHKYEDDAAQAGLLPHVEPVADPAEQPHDRTMV